MDGATVREEVAIAPTDRILDIGCGTGNSTRRAARRASSGSVLGVDLSSRMLDEARRRSADEGLTNVEYLQADAQVHQFEPEVHDLAISSFGVMFFNDPLAAFTNIGRGLRPGGRIAMLAWQRFDDNEWLTTIWDALAAGRDLPRPAPGSPGPFGLADPETVTPMLGDAGFVKARMASWTEPVWMGADANDAWTFVSGLGVVRGLTGGLDDDTRSRAMADSPGGRRSRDRRGRRDAERGRGSSPRSGPSPVRRRWPPGSTAWRSRLVVRPGLREGDARIAEHLRRERRGQPDGDHAIDEGAARELALLHVRDKATQCFLVHVKTPRFEPALGVAHGPAFHGPARPV